MSHRAESGKSSRRGARATGTADLRVRIAAEAARLIAETGLRDYAFAKQKAAQRLGIQDESALPKNAEIDDALRAHQRLFRADDHALDLRKLRETALEAMEFLAEFQPRLVDAVLEGTADRYSVVSLHLFSDDPDAPTRFLDERGIRHATGDRRLRTSRGQFAQFPTIAFDAGEAAIDLTIFSVDALHHPPLDRSGDKPMRRASVAALRLLLDSAETTTI